MKQIANKPLINLFWDRGVDSEQGIPVDFNDTAPKDKTQVFLLSPEVALAAEKLVRSPAFRFPALTDLHMPYEHTAIEIPLTPEIRQIRSSTPQGSEPIDSVGAHVWAPEPGAFICTPYWRFNTGRLQYSGFSFTLGVEMDQYKILINTREVEEGAIEMGVIFSEGVRKGMERAKLPIQLLTDKIVERDAQIFTHIREAAVEIPLLVFASSMLLNCKTGVTRSQIAARTCNVSGYGAKRRKALSASAYTVLHLEEMEKVSSDGTISAKTEITAHYVRGHFKQRSSGIYWWNPFIRGSGRPKRREAYIVRSDSCHVATPTALVANLGRSVGPSAGAPA